jgi:hypothetical protein
MGLLDNPIDRCAWYGHENGREKSALGVNAERAL